MLRSSGHRRKCAPHRVAIRCERSRQVQPCTRLGRLQWLVLFDRAPGDQLPYEPFLLDAESRTKPTSFELQFLAEGEVFRYGISYDAKRVHEEWLNVYEGTKERQVFSRETSEDEVVTVRLGPRMLLPQTGPIKSPHWQRSGPDQINYSLRRL